MYTYIVFPWISLKSAANKPIFPTCPLSHLAKLSPGDGAHLTMFRPDCWGMSYWPNGFADHYPYKMAISLGIYPIFRQTHML